MATRVRSLVAFSRKLRCEMILSCPCYSPEIINVTDIGGEMLDSRVITSTCENCQQENNLSLSYFVGHDYNFEESVIATCQSCNMDFIVAFDESMIR